MDKRQQAVTAGQRLRQLREDQHITQQMMEKLTAERFGYEARVFAQQVSRIEKGALDKPPIIDLLRIGQVLGLSPDDIAEMYGLWPRQPAKETLDPRLQSAIDLAAELPLMEREKFLEWVRFAVLQARAEHRAAVNPPHNEGGEGAAPASASPVPERVRKSPASHR